jgi:hypothetical protein
LAPTFTLSVSGPNLKSLIVTSVPVEAGAAALLDVLALEELALVDAPDVLAFESASLLQAAASATTQTRPTTNESGVRMRCVLCVLIKRVFGPAGLAG